MKTLDEEFNEKFGWLEHGGKRDADNIKAWFKFYLLNFAESVRLKEKYEERQISCPERKGGCAVFHIEKFADEKYNQALSDQQTKISEELKKRGL